VRIAIVTYCRREDGHPGGVPKWAWYLKRALEEAGHEARHFCWRDYPEWRRCDRLPEHEKARALSAWLATERVGAQHAVPLRCYDRIIADGFWASGLPDDAPVTVVCHGTWAGLAAACGGVAPELIEAQGEAYRRFPVVAVSKAAARQVERYHGVRVAAIIPNGVDLGVFRPAAEGCDRMQSLRQAPSATLRTDQGRLCRTLADGTAGFEPADTGGRAPLVVLYAGEGYAKGEDIVREVCDAVASVRSRATRHLARQLDGEACAEDGHSRASVALRAMEPKGRCRIHYLNAAIGMEAHAFQRGDVLLFPSRHEGDSYALKEALACGLPVAASAVGALEDERPPEIGEVVEGFEAEDYCAAVRRVVANRGAYQPRAWAERNAGFGDFARRWVRYLGSRREPTSPCEAGLRRPAKQGRGSHM
jgi:glycosyltransferase involved in cell wall biosynthesis